MNTHGDDRNLRLRPGSAVADENELEVTRGCSKKEEREVRRNLRAEALDRGDVFRWRIRSVCLRMSELKPARGLPELDGSIAWVLGHEAGFVALPGKLRVPMNEVQA
jgi:hypothetical protein